MKRSLWRYVPVVLIAVAIPLLSLLPAVFFRKLSEGIPLFPGFDKAVHASMYAALTTAAVFAFPWMQRLRAFLLLAAWAALYGGLMELAQRWLTNSRSCDVWDGAANAAGAFIAALLYYFFRRVRTN